MTPFKKSMTAAELLAALQKDPEWVRRNEEREAHRRAAEARFRVEEESIVVALSRAGFQVESVWDLVNSSARYPEAIPVLLDHLRRPYHPKIREGIARALTVEEAKEIAAGPILQQLKQELDPQVRWVLANALTIVADQANASEIKALAEDPGYEDVRERLRQALKRLFRS